MAFGDGGSASGSDSYAKLDFQRYGDMDYEAESDTYHAQFRQYSQKQGRWMRPDPYSGGYKFSNPQSLNRYTYVKNNPIARIDPLGLDDVPCPPEQAARPGKPHPAEDGGCINNPTDPAPPPPPAPPCDNCGDDDGDDGSDSPLGYIPVFDETSYGTTLSDQDININYVSPDESFSLLSYGITGGQVPVHGIWHYGNYCGPDGMGTPTNAVDTLCMHHDTCFGNTRADFTSMLNLAVYNQLSASQQADILSCNQTLCNGLTAVAPTIPLWNVGEQTAAWEINVFFHSLVPAGAQCH